MARLYANENLPLQVVRELRTLGHDVLTSLEAGRANRRIADAEVLEFATSRGRALLTQNRRDFLRLHNTPGIQHSGIILCTADPDFAAQAQRINGAVLPYRDDLPNTLIRVNRPHANRDAQ
jgi:predicted nuclease of predicted toxin-antitoxin system